MLQHGLWWSQLNHVKLQLYPFYLFISYYMYRSNLSALPLPHIIYSAKQWSWIIYPRWSATIALRLATLNNNGTDWDWWLRLWKRRWGHRTFWIAVEHWAYQGTVLYYISLSIYFRVYSLISNHWVIELEYEFSRFYYISIL